MSQDRRSFSQRNGYKKVRDSIQIESLDEPTRNRIWNVIYQKFLCLVDMSHRLDWKRYFYDTGLVISIEKVWDKITEKPIDSIPNNYEELTTCFREITLNHPWPVVFDLLEYIYEHYPDVNHQYRVRESKHSGLQFCNAVNEVFEKECVGYRFVKGLITNIVTPIEIDEIESAISSPEKSVTEHLQTALALYSDRKDPDYRNSIKESISAVEAKCGVLLGGTKPTLGAALKEIEQQIGIHPALKDAFAKLYGYTSDEGGIRHALTEDSRTVTEAEARFMLISCSAFINYLTSIQPR